VIPVVDAPRIDVGAIDARAVDAGAGIDGIQVLVDAQRAEAGDVGQADAAVDVQVTGAETGRDTASPVPEPNADAAPPVNADAALPVKNDAAVTPLTDIKVMGGGFCALSQSRAASPAGFALLALGALALLRRRRR
jgi:MYXO-CTERM domain-containing protein